MPNQKDKSITLTSLFSQMDDMLKQSVSYEELRQAMDLFIARFKELQKDIAKKTAENKDEMKAETKRLGEQVAEFEARLRILIDEGRAGSKGELDVLRNELSAYIGYVESLIEKYDDSEVRGLIEEVRGLIPDMPDMPEEFDATDLVTSIDALKSDIEELKKRPAASGGGVRRVFQPYLSRFQGDGSTKTFYLKREPLRTDNIEVWCTDFPIVLDPDNDFTVTGKTLTLTAAVSAPTNGAIIVVKYYA